MVLDPDRMRTLGVTQRMVVEALKNANQAAGGSVVELAETEYMVRSQGFLRSLDDFRSIPLSAVGATPVMLRDVAFVQIGPEMRRGIAELDGEGVVVDALDGCPGLLVPHRDRAAILALGHVGLLPATRHDVLLIHAHRTEVR